MWHARVLLMLWGNFTRRWVPLVAACLLIAGLIPLQTAPALSAAGKRFDILIRNGRVVDGSGNPWFTADIGIRGGTIAAIGDLKNATANRTIDAAGLYVAPGFIDSHNHSDRGLRDPQLRSAAFWLLQGVTTVVLGVDGMGTLGLPGELKTWEKSGMGINTAFYVGQNPIRTQVMGISNRSATAAEIARMQSLVRQGMENGALGLSTGLVYIPSVYSSTDEVVDLAKVAAEYGGVYDTHHRDEMVAFRKSLREALDITRRAHLPLIIAHIKVMGQDNWGQMADAVREINQARAEGQEITANQYCWPNAAMRTSLASMIQIPPELGKLAAAYASLNGNPPDFANDGQQAEYTAELVQALNDPASREKIRIANEQGMDQPSARNWIRKWGYGWLRVEVSQQNPQWVGLTIPQIAAREKTDPFTIVAKLIRTEDKRFVVSIGPADERDVVTVLREPWVMFSSDGELTTLGPRWINPRSLGSFARPYRKYVREEHVIRLEDAVRKMTGLAGQSLRLRDRGLLREGMAADVTIFDASKMADKSTYADSLHFPDGVVDVLVNGVVSLENGKPTGKLAGRVLYRPESKPALAQAEEYAPAVAARSEPGGNAVRNESAAYVK